MISSLHVPSGPAPPPPIRAIAVIGAGQAGREFAIRCAVAGFQVILEDVMPAKLRHAEQHLLTVAPELTGGSLTFALTVEDAVRSADLAIDFVPDDLESKLEIFCMLDRMAPPRTTLLTPTEVLSITDLASCTYRPERCFALRGAFGPAPQPSNLISPRGHSASALAMVTDFLAALGDDVLVHEDKDAPMLMKNIS